MDSPSDTPPTPGSRATAFLGSILTGSPTGAHSDSILIPGRLEPCEHDLSDWHAPSENRAPSPSALLDLARDFIEAYRAATWLFDAWDAPRRAIAARFAAVATSAWRTGLTAPGVRAALDVLQKLQVLTPMREFPCARDLVSALTDGLVNVALSGHRLGPPPISWT